MISPQANERVHSLLEDGDSFVLSFRQIEALPPEDRRAVLEFAAFVMRRRRQRAAASETRHGLAWARRHGKGLSERQDYVAQHLAER
ncbi:MAG: hypothetical protein HY669_04705 [Chloroflexi bacterium]|nr:hypothetical protein [Chloroflexota bacterium]